MSEVIVNEQSLQNIANSIRLKLNSSNTYKPSEMSTAIDNISQGITPTGTLEINENGTYNVTNYANANVNIEETFSTDLYVEKTYKFTLKKIITDGKFGLNNADNASVIEDDNSPAKIETVSGVVVDSTGNSYAYVCNDTVQLINDTFGGYISGIPSLTRNKWYFMDVENGVATVCNDAVQTTSIIDNVYILTEGNRVQPTVDTSGNYYYDASSLSWLFDNIEEISVPKLQYKSLTIAENGTSIVVPDTGYDGLEEVDIFTNVKTELEITDASYLFYEDSRYNDINSYINCLSNVTKTSFMFAQHFTYTVMNMPNFDTSNVTNMDGMFSSTYTSNINIPEYDVRNVTTAQSMFSICSSLRSISNFNFEKLTSTNRMFEACGYLTDISNFNFPVLNNMSRMFYNCFNLTNISLNLGSTERNINMYYTFFNCKSLNNIPNFVTNISHLVQAAASCFNSCSNFQNIQNLNYPNLINAPGMFENCTLVSTVSNISINSADNLSGMFRLCSNLTSISDVNISGTYVSVRNMFQSCTKLATVTNLIITGIVNAHNMFADCNSLTDVPEFNTADVTNVTTMFYHCNNLSDASIQNIINTIINSNITSYRNLSNRYSSSPFYQTNIDNSRYTNRHADLSNAGWSY